MVFMQGPGRFSGKFAADYGHNPPQLRRIFLAGLIEQFSLIDLFLDLDFFVTQSRHDGFDVFRLNFGCAEQFIELIEGYEACLAATFRWLYGSGAEAPLDDTPEIAAPTIRGGLGPAGANFQSAGTN
jgi:hypothetical protein